MAIDLAESDERVSFIPPNEISVTGEDDCIGIVITGNEAITWFKILVNRAMTTWDRAPWELKVFADQFISGVVLQDYKTQDPENTINVPPATRT